MGASSRFGLRICKQSFEFVQAPRHVALAHDPVEFVAGFGLDFAHHLLPYALQDIRTACCRTKTYGTNASGATTAENTRMVRTVLRVSVSWLVSELFMNDRGPISV